MADIELTVSADKIHGWSSNVAAGLVEQDGYLGCELIFLFQVERWYPASLLSGNFKITTGSF